MYIENFQVLDLVDQEHESASAFTRAALDRAMDHVCDDSSIAGAVDVDVHPRRQLFVRKTVAELSDFTRAHERSLELNTNVRAIVNNW